MALTDKQQNQHILSNSKIVYVASPYWHESKEIRDYRRQKAIEYSKLLFRKKIPFYSPLLFSEIFKENKASEGYWLNHGKKMVEVCSELRVLCLDGWEESSGVCGEIEIAKSLGLPIKYIKKHQRISFHGSRSLTMEQCEPVILDIFEQMLPETVITHGEPHGACECVRELAKKEKVSLKLHFLPGHKAAGQYHWRSTAVLEDGEIAIFLHDGESKGTSNELLLAQQKGIDYRYFCLNGDVLVEKKVLENGAIDENNNGDSFEINVVSNWL